jgi:hypothetical protein
MILLTLHLGKAAKRRAWRQDKSYIRGTTLLDDLTLHLGEAKNGKTGARTIHRLVGRPYLMILLILHQGKAAKRRSCRQDNS